MKLIKLQKQNSFMAVRNLLTDELIINYKIQEQYYFLNLSFEGSELEKDYVKLDTRYRNDKHLIKITK